MKKTILFLVVLAFFVTKSNSQTVTDYDGNIYNTVTIGTQVWMKENLKTTKYNDGTFIPLVTGETAWKNLLTPGYCWYNNDTNYYKNTYGALYNWYTINTGKLCPIGWHIPTDSEWTALGSVFTGGNLKATDTVFWRSPNTGANNNSGFSGLPGGGRYSFSGSFILIRNWGYWWSSTNLSPIPSAYNRGLAYNNESIYKANYDLTAGFSVRCMRDTPADINEINYKDKIDIYPNPVTDRIYINYFTSQNLKMHVYNSVGQCVLQRELNNQTNEIDISSLTRGIYILKLTSSNGTIEKKIIKE